MIAAVAIALARAFGPVAVEGSTVEFRDGGRTYRVHLRELP